MAVLGEGKIKTEAQFVDIDFLDVQFSEKKVYNHNLLARWQPAKRLQSQGGSLMANNPTYEELAQKVMELQKAVSDHKLIEETLRENLKRYKTLWDDAPGAYHMLDNRGIITQVNQTEANMLGYAKDEMEGKPIFDFVLPEQREEAEERFRLKLAGKRVPKHVNRIYLRKDGAKIYVAIDDTLDFDVNGKVIGVRTTMVDVTQQKRAEEKLRERKEALKLQAHSLEEVNTALKVLLRRRDEDKIELEEKVLANVKELILPYLETLKNTRLDATQMAYTGIIESLLKDIVSPFLRSLSSKYMGLTRREVQVAGFVKEGKTNKEIAELLNVSVRAVEAHRENIRAKLGLKHQPVNLRSFLLSLQ